MSLMKTMLIALLLSVSALAYPSEWSQRIITIEVGEECPAFLGHIKSNKFCRIEGLDSTGHRIVGPIYTKGRIGEAVQITCKFDRDPVLCKPRAPVAQ